MRANPDQTTFSQLCCRASLLLCHAIKNNSWYFYSASFVVQKNGIDSKTSLKFWLGSGRDEVFVYASISREPMTSIVTQRCFSWQFLLGQGGSIFFLGGGGGRRTKSNRRPFPSSSSDNVPSRNKERLFIRTHCYGYVLFLLVNYYEYLFVCWFIYFNKTGNILELYFIKYLPLILNNSLHDRWFIFLK